MAGSDTNNDSHADSDEPDPEVTSDGQQHDSEAWAEEPTSAFSRPSSDSAGRRAAGSNEAAQQFGKYTIEEQLGRGGMGVVWKAFDPDLHRTVAIKVLGEHLAHSPTSRRRFQREARAAAAINHANVLTIHSVEDEGGVPFLVMEYVHGHSLKEYVAEEGTLAPTEVIRLGSQIAQGLAAAHAQGVIHRDVKPGNVMLHEGATCARLTDFGLARVAFDNVELTSHDHCVGTPSYMSPESLRGQPIDARSDLFSLGCVLYMMLIGYPPFQGRSQGEIIHKIIDSKPVRLHDLNPSIPPVLSDIVERLLRKDPDERMQSAAEVADVLARLQQQVNQAPTDQIPNVLAGASTDPDSASRGGMKMPWIPLMLVGVVVALMFSRPLLNLTLDSNRSNSNSELPPATEHQPDESQALATADNTSAEVVQKLRDMTVGTGPNDDFSTIADAVRHADRGARISVVGPGPYDEAVQLDGDAIDGLRIVASPRAVWRVPKTAEHRCLTIGDVKDVGIEGIDFEVDSESGRAVSLLGDTRNVTFVDCGFRHVLETHKLSVVHVATSPKDEASSVAFINCRFVAAQGPVMCLALGANESASRVECTNCQFSGPNTHIYSNDACHRLMLKHNIFIGGSNAINLSIESWWPDSHIEIVNNTFLGTRYWLGLMDSFRSDSLPAGKTKSLVCNNLILGGERMQGGDDQWQVALHAWTFAANWWERDLTTRGSAGRGGQVATLHDKLDISKRSTISDVDYLVPAIDSSLLTSGVGGDLPEYIGARTSQSSD